MAKASHELLQKMPPSATPTPVSSILWASTPNFRVSPSPNFWSWLPSFGSCFQGSSSVWKHCLDLLYVVRYEVIGPFDFPSHTFSWLTFQPTSIPSFVSLGSVARDDSLYIQTLYTLATQTMRIRSSHTLTLKHTLSTKISTHHSHCLWATFACYQCLLTCLHHQCQVSIVLWACYPLHPQSLT